MVRIIIRFLLSCTLDILAVHQIPALLHHPLLPHLVGSWKFIKAFSVWKGLSVVLSAIGLDLAASSGGASFDFLRLWQYWLWAICLCKPVVDFSFLSQYLHLIPTMVLILSNAAFVNSKKENRFT
jgi:hypothetical protein